MSNAINLFTKTYLDIFIRIRSFLCDGHADSFSRTCKAFEAVDRSYRRIHATGILNPAEKNTSSLSSLIQPLASLDLTTCAGLYDFNTRVVRAIHSLGGIFPTNRVVEIGDCTQTDQAIEDKALVKIWPKICAAIPSENAGANLDPTKIPDTNAVDAAAIRTWMNSNPLILESIRELDLSEMNLSALPKEIGLLTHLQMLDLYENRLTMLPDSFGQLANLQKLYLYRNSLTILPDSFGKLVNLQKLYLQNNQLTTLPDSFGKLSNLQRLFLFENQLTTLSESFGQLTHLQELNLYNNRLTTLPESFGNLANLQTLDLETNQLISFPESFDKLSHLQTLQLSNNQLKTLPDSFGRLANLQKLHLQNNQLTTLPSYTSRIERLYTDGNPLSQNPAGS